MLMPTWHVFVAICAWHMFRGQRNNTVEAELNFHFIKIPVNKVGSLGLHGK